MSYLSLVYEGHLMTGIGKGAGLYLGLALIPIMHRPWYKADLAALPLSLFVDES